MSERDEERGGTGPAEDAREARDPVDEAAEESFPGSDPPSWSPSHAGDPRDEGHEEEPRRRQGQ